MNRGRLKVCYICEGNRDSRFEDQQVVVDYKNDRLLRRFVTERGKIIPRRISGNCAGHQRQLTVAIKRSRHIALIPFTAE